jgi:hypothetical protein
MRTESCVNASGYLFISIGIALSVVSALVPHFDAGHHLMLSVFSAGILPYLVYGIAVPLMRSHLTTAVGLVIVTVHAWLVFSERIVGGADYSDGRIFYVPVILAVFTIPLAMAAIKKAARH